MVAAQEKILSLIYARLYRRFGPQSWWPVLQVKESREDEARPETQRRPRGRPANEKFEVIVGAILTQNTNWGNVERAITNLKQRRILSSTKLHRLPQHDLAQLIKPAGYFNVKAKRLKNFLNFFFHEYAGNISRMQKEETATLRRKLLNVNGIGPETADSILLYALDKPVFVVDAYTKRIFSRHKIVRNDHDYHAVQEVFTKAIAPERQTYNEYHALIVRLGKDYCRTRPKCTGCPLRFLNEEKRFYPYRFEGMIG